MISRLFVALFWGLIVYFVFKVIRFFKGATQINRTAPPRKNLSGIMVKDEICNTYLPKENAIKEIFQGKEYFFCSDSCRKKFLQTRKEG